MTHSTRIDESVRQFLISTVLAGASTDVGIDTPLVDAGVVDSFTMLQIAEFAEEAFGARIPAEQILPRNFRSVRSISELVERHMPSEATHGGA